MSTTVFNAAFEAGLPIETRTNHALYISHYPLGRDATVNYPDTDLRFRNDTDKWLLLRTFVGSSALTVSLYGAPQHRRVETETAPLRVVAQPPVQRTEDPTLPVGKTVVDDYGEPARATSVHRTVYAPDGKLLYDTTWYSSYVSEPKLVRVGTKKPKPKPEKEPPPKTEAPRDTPATDGAAPGHGRDYDYDAGRPRAAALASARSIASISHCGTRVGRKLSRSTVAWPVQPSAIGSPSRSITYS